MQLENRIQEFSNFASIFEGEIKMEYVSRKRGCQQPPAPGSALSTKGSCWRTLFFGIHRVACSSCDNKMVDLQRTLCFDEDILPCLLKEREIYSGQKAEKENGIVMTGYFSRCSCLFIWFLCVLYRGKPETQKGFSIPYEFLVKPNYNYLHLHLHKI